MVVVCYLQKLEYPLLRFLRLLFSDIASIA